MNRTNGFKLTVAETAKLMYDEAVGYYKDGAKYTHDGKTYTCGRHDKYMDGLNIGFIKLTSETKEELFLAAAFAGTLLPGVASDGMEIAKVYDLGGGYLGNGVVYWNRMEEVNGDYKKIAHIEADRYVKFYEPLPEYIKHEIIGYAAAGTPQNSAGNDIFYAKPPTLPELVQYREYWRKA
jgi:hypothetical protein